MSACVMLFRAILSYHLDQAKGGFRRFRTFRRFYRPDFFSPSTSGAEGGIRCGVVFLDYKVGVHHPHLLHPTSF